MRISDWSSDVCSSDPYSDCHGSGSAVYFRICVCGHYGWQDDAQAKNMIDRFSRQSALHPRSEEHTSELQSLMRISYAVFCLQKKTNTSTQIQTIHITRIQTNTKYKRANYTMHSTPKYRVIK